VARLRELAVAGAKVYVALDFQRGDNIDADEWASLTRKEVITPPQEQIGNSAGSGIRVWCMGGGRQMRYSHASMGGGNHNLSLSLAFVRQARDCSIHVGWERLGMTDIVIDVPGGPMWA
jgi:hypothetical protein